MTDQHAAVDYLEHLRARLEDAGDPPDLAAAFGVLGGIAEYLDAAALEPGEQVAARVLAWAFPDAPLPDVPEPNVSGLALALRRLAADADALAARCEGSRWATDRLRRQVASLLSDAHGRRVHAACLAAVRGLPGPVVALCSPEIRRRLAAVAAAQRPNTRRLLEPVPAILQGGDR